MDTTRKKVVVDSWAWIDPEDLRPGQKETLKSRLTVMPRKAVGYPGDEEPRPICLYTEEAGMFGIARQYFMENVTSAYEVELQVTEGLKEMWAGPIAFKGSLRAEQLDALNVVSSQLKAGRLGGIVKAVPGWGKCLAKGSIVVEGTSGRRAKIEDLVGKQVLVPSLKGNEIRYELASKIWLSGVKPCVRIQTTSGRKIVVSTDHPILTPNGYVRAGTLKRNAKVAEPSYVPAPDVPRELFDTNEVVVAAYLLASGILLGRNRARFAASTWGTAREFLHSVKKLKSYAFHRRRRSAKSEELMITVWGLEDWAKAEGVWEGDDKRVPAKFFGLPNDLLALFLSRMFSRSTIDKGPFDPRFEVCLANEGLADDVQFLLKRFGVVTRKKRKVIRRVSPEGQTRSYVFWFVRVDGDKNLARMMAAIGTIPGKEEECEKLKELCGKRSRPAPWDRVPIGTSALKEIYKERQSNPEVWLPWKRQSLLTMDRDEFLSLCERAGYAGKFWSQARMPVIWERVQKIENLGSQEVYDLTVPTTENAVVNGVIVHNTVFACSLIAQMNVPTLIVVHKEFLMNQWRERLEQFLPGIRIGIAQQDQCDYVGKHVVLGMVHSLAGKDYPANFANWPGMIVVDETHRIGAETWSVVPAKFRARWRLGLTATPRRKDGADNVFLYHIGPLLYSAKEKRLSPKIRRVWTDFKLVGTPRFNPNLAPKSLMLKFVCASESRNKAIVGQVIQAIKAGRKILVLSERLNHLKMLERMTSLSWPRSEVPGPSTGFYVGGMSEDELEKSSQKKVIFATSQFVAEGLDIPALDTLFLTTPLGDIEQASGRILRPFEGKKEPIVVDFRDDNVPLFRKLGEMRDRTYQKILG